ncbi:DUF6289 family protein [Luteimonas sp. R10]|uniref:DUF6289 family protein n=1 Tax=Luteimonas sp. R10 TaxID=3108176 RepID=UPI00308594ED|nr:DUF6289 family protein [Luteimonas sp. R10]
MKIRLRRALTAFAIAAAVLFVAGTAFARFPIQGKEWGEWTRYDSSGNAIGGGRIECDGTMVTWGESGRPTPMTIHPCY